MWGREGEKHDLLCLVHVGITSSVLPRTILKGDNNDEKRDGAMKGKTVENREEIVMEIKMG